ncbi:MAG TPA: outer membrane protein transport protein [Armatimonadota bacterium]|jgi:long-chain fatty acid transport protein
MTAFWRRCLPVLAVLAMAWHPSVAEATNGYFSEGYGTKSKAMAGTGVALPQDSLAAATNPAGMAFVGRRFDLGLALFNPERFYNVKGAPSGATGTFGLAPGEVRSGRDWFTIPSFGVNWTAGKRASLGLTVIGNGGLNTSYSGSVSGGQGTFYAGPAGVNLCQVFVMPTFAYKLSEGTSLGISGIVAHQMFHAQGLSSFGSMVSDGSPDNLSNRETDHSTGFGAKFGVLTHATRKLALGASYQTRIEMSRFKRYSDLFPERGEFDIPPTATVGLTWQAQPSTKLSFDVQKIWYGSVPAVAYPFANLGIGMQNGDTSRFLGGQNGVGFGWKDMTVYKAGYQWEGRKGWTWRAGLSYGRNPVRSSEVLFNILAPGVQDWHYTGGFTKKVGTGGELSLAVTVSPTRRVTGPNPLEVPGRQQIELSMRQLEVELGWGKRF